jgi:hypothetical protein
MRIVSKPFLSAQYGGAGGRGKGLYQQSSSPSYERPFAARTNRNRFSPDARWQARAHISRFTFFGK